MDFFCISQVALTSAWFHVMVLQPQQGKQCGAQADAGEYGIPGLGVKGRGPYFAP